MRNSLTKLMVVTGVAAALSIPVLVTPAHAQDQFVDGQQGMADGFNEGYAQGNTGTQTRNYTGGQAPQLQGATNGTIGPQGQDATVISGVNTAGTVRVNNLANLEAL